MTMSKQGDSRESGYESINADGERIAKGEKLKVQRDQGGSDVRPVDPANGNVNAPNATVPVEKV
jgi:hypothetical protein